MNNQAPILPGGSEMAEYVKQLIAKGQEELEDTTQKLAFEQWP
jgi:hypothetical protein